MEEKEEIVKLSAEKIKVLNEMLEVYQRDFRKALDPDDDEDQLYIFKMNRKEMIIMNKILIDYKNDKSKMFNNEELMLLHRIINKERREYNIKSWRGAQ